MNNFEEAHTLMSSVLECCPPPPPGNIQPSPDFASFNKCGVTSSEKTKSMCGLLSLKLFILQVALWAPWYTSLEID